jgi:hypothetical protein
LAHRVVISLAGGGRSRGPRTDDGGPRAGGARRAGRTAASVLFEYAPVMSGFNPPPAQWHRGNAVVRGGRGRNAAVSIRPRPDGPGQRGGRPYKIVRRAGFHPPPAAGPPARPACSLRPDGTATREGFEPTEVLPGKPHLSGQVGQIPAHPQFPTPVWHVSTLPGRRCRSRSVGPCRR